MSYLSVGVVLVQSDGLNSVQSPVVYGDIARSIKTNTQNTETRDSAFSNLVFPLNQNQSRTALYGPYNIEVSFRIWTSLVCGYGYQ